MPGKGERKMVTLLAALAGKIFHHTINGVAFLAGPNFWGRLNPKWSLCTKGRRQSPIDIDPETLLFDQFLSPLQLIGDHVSHLSAHQVSL